MSRDECPTLRIRRGAGGRIVEVTDGRDILYFTSERVYRSHGKGKPKDISGPTIPARVQEEGP